MAVTLNSKNLQAAIEGFLAGPVLLKGRALHQSIAKDALRNLVQYTPVDTGRARGNWRVNYGDPSISFDPNKKDKSGSATVSEGNGRIMAKEWRNWSGQYTGDLYISNNTPYIDALNDGHPTHGAFQSHNQGLGFMLARTKAFLIAKYSAAFK